MAAIRIGSWHVPCVDSRIVIDPAGVSGASPRPDIASGGLLSATFIDLIFILFFFVLVSRMFGK